MAKMHLLILLSSPTSCCLPAFLVVNSTALPLSDLHTMAATSYQDVSLLPCVPVAGVNSAQRP